MPKSIPIIFYMFSCASNLKSFQVMYLKFAEKVDMLVQIVNAKFGNESKRTIGILDKKKIR